MLRFDIRSYAHNHAGRIVFACILSLGIAILLEGMTLFGAPGSSVLDVSSWSKTRIAIFFCVALVSTGICALCCPSFKSCCQRNIRERRLRQPLLKFLWVLLGALGAGVVVYFVFQLLERQYFSFAIAVLTFFVVLLASGLIVFRKFISKKPEYGFILVSLCAGLAMVAIFPQHTVLSWDDQIHYDRSIALSYIVGPEYTEADVNLIQTSYPDLDRRLTGEGGETAFSQQRLSDIYQALNGLAVSGDVHSIYGFQSYSGTPTAQYTTIGYLPSALGLWVGRFMHLPFTLTYALGKIFNLLAYSLIVFFAIRRLKVGKLLLAGIALFPTSIFLSANYSYDPWVIAWIMFAVAWFVGELQKPNEHVTWQSSAVMVGACLIGCGPKAIYFPIVLLLLLMPKRKFRKTRDRKRYIRTVLATSASIALSFVLPILLGGAGAGDARGGSDVNSTEQIRFILSNPFEYAAILLQFLQGYLAPENSIYYSSFLGYAGIFGYLSVLPIIFVCVLSVADSDKRTFSYAGALNKVITLVILLAIAVLIVSALYVSFTPVGLSTVNGCQPRYLLPLLFPFFILVMNCKVENKMNPQLFALSVFSLSGFILIFAIQQTGLLPMIP